MCRGFLGAAVLGVITTYALSAGTVFLGRRPGATLAVAGNVAFNVDGREYWAQQFAGSGFERVDITPMRGRGLVMYEGQPNFEPFVSTVDLVDRIALGPESSDPLKRPGLTVQFHRAGWPWRTTQAVTAHTWSGTTPSVAIIRGGFAVFGEGAIMATSSKPSILPFEPIWRNFLASTTLWTCAWAFGVLIGPFGVRRVWRHRRGQCLECGYLRDRIHPNVVCPECGGAL